MSSPTIKDVAKSANVSIATVSRVLNHSETVHKHTQERVLEAMDLLGYNRNEVARSLKFRHTKTIGIIAPELSNIFFMEVVEAIERCVGPFGYSLLITSSNDSIEEEKRKLQIFIERNVDGIVVMPAGAEGQHFLTKALDKIPLVMVDRCIEGINVDFVETDSRYGVHQMIKALSHEGYKRIGYIGGDLSIHTAHERLFAYLEAMEELGLKVENRFVYHQGSMTQTSGRSLIRQALLEVDYPEAFFIANDSLHLGATIQALEMLSSSQLDQLVFASFDYLSYAPLLKLCHYAVAQPCDKIGEEVSTLLLKRLNGNWEDYPKHVMLRPEIKVLRANGGIPYPLGNSKSNMLSS
ncbi:LacI family DNA-binding transcriptional regulator [Sphaerochaeta halotolerans]|jgi:LacI family transcriptional regulator|uniref:LacI family DNA-binding transcriptional regulator n=1 Tax=Sphaerochaeta halotolerans TaxID=2293840 RepID=UPI00136A4918|nr:LacI family DNA-binding transcriptional regulator [Sphaerochaeta halotolerans]MXI85912.1 LacI family DNA-binding transcriptional regulator [Sphaerochaeta halotolerans]